MRLVEKWQRRRCWPYR